MNLAWTSDVVRQICCSKNGLVDLWPGSARRAQTLLTVIGHAHDLNTLRRLRSVVVRLGDEAGLATAGLSISLEEVEMHASVITKTGELLLPSDTKTAWNDLGDSRSLLVHEILAANDRLTGVA